MTTLGTPLRSLYLTYAGIADHGVGDLPRAASGEEVAYERNHFTAVQLDAAHELLVR